ncbi:hypothetical protein [Marinicella meishanensis]|uniref:hypothetical protein n=1 Tax=Marinicella meishanensis TaxID=2873263 RepID=UPI001CBE5198|nr:hypothetical protein [Marinicella sp. NBU2979]
MKHRTCTIPILLLFMAAAQAAEMRFDQHGNMLLPDHTYLTQGLKDHRQGYPNDAMRNLKKAAKFGNPYAQSAIAYIHLQQKEHQLALAWFQLVDLKMIDKDQAIIELMDALQKHLSAAELQAVDRLYQALKLEYGKSAALEHRIAWQNGIAIGGTKLKGKVPGRVKIYPSARIEKKGMETEIFVSGTVVSGESVRLQMDEFVFEYELRFTEGRVRMGELELLEEEAQI